MLPLHSPFPSSLVPNRGRQAPVGLEEVRRAAKTARLSSNASDALVALIQALPAVLGKRLVVYEAGARDTSFDEAWLLNAFEAIRQGDTDRYCFAMLSRMKRVEATELHFLMCKAAWTLDVSD
jgi:hypothetical protein